MAGLSLPAAASYLAALLIGVLLVFLLNDALRQKGAASHAGAASPLAPYEASAEWDPRLPPLLHQMWLDRDWYDNEEPRENVELYAEYTRQWLALNPELTRRFWNRKRIDELWATACEQDPASFRPYADFYYNVLTRHIERCDFARFLVLYMHGGGYVDLDLAPLHRLAPLSGEIVRDRKGLGLIAEPSEHCSAQAKVTNGAMFSIPRHPFWLRTMDRCMREYRAHKSVLANTGPVMLARQATEDGVPLLPSWTFLPLVFPGKNKRPRVTRDAPPGDVFENPRCYAYTKWNEGTSWAGLRKKASDGDPTFRRRPL